MEALTRLVAESLARHGLDRPVDPRRLQWSRWSRCDSPHSLLVVPSKPGIFALAEEIAELGTDRVGAGDSPAQVGKSMAELLGGAALQRCDSLPPKNAALAADSARRMLAVLQFSEDDDMAFVLDRMFTRPNPMRARLASGRCFLRFVVLEDQTQRRSICSALNQWMISSAEKASGISADFAWSLELTDRVGAGDSPAQSDRMGQPLSANAGRAAPPAQAARPEPPTDPTHPAAHATAPHLDSGAATNIHCPQPLPSGF